MGVGEKETYSSCQGTPRSSCYRFWGTGGREDGESGF